MGRREELNAQHEPWWTKEPLRIIEICTLLGRPDHIGAAKQAGMAGRLAPNMQHLHVMRHGPGCGLTDEEFYFRTTLARKKNPDYLARYLPEARKRGIKAVVYFNVHVVDPAFGKRHPGWLQRKQDGRAMDGIYRSAMSFCVNSSWRDWCFQLLQDLCAYDIGGIFYDGPCFYTPTCYCRSCSAKFRKFYGKKLPPKDDKKHPDFPLLLEFRRGASSTSSRIRTG